MKSRAALLVLLLAGCAAPTPTTVQLAQETPIALPDGPGKDKVGQCVACHSLDYIAMNSRFLDKAGWTASVNKMINVFGAPIPKEDVEPIAAYLAQHYGK
ncbi:MAG: cytochrome c [Pseudomonadota bacterium]